MKPENNMSFEEQQEILSVCLDEIVKLKEENLRLQERLDSITATEHVLMDGLKKMVQLTQQQASYYQLNKNLIYNGVDNIKYELYDNIDHKYCYPEFYHLEETLDLIINQKKSMARFGDGEFAIMAGETRHKFQQADQHLGQRLQEVIQCEEDGLLIAIADNYGNLDKYNSAQGWEIRSYMSEQHRQQHMRFLDLSRKYHNAYISRPYAMYADNRTDAPYYRFQNLKKIWDSRNVIFIEGSLTRMGVGNDLFDNAAQIKRIVAPPTDAFAQYDKILNAALQYADSDTLFLIALGPTASILAYDLFHAGNQALDIGHLDLEYEWYLKGEGDRCEIKNKYNNEMDGGDVVEDIDDPQYTAQILCAIGNH